MTSTRIRLLQAGSALLIAGFVLTGCVAGEEPTPAGKTYDSSESPSPTPSAVPQETDAPVEATAESAAAAVTEFMVLATTYPTDEDLAVLGLPEAANTETANEAFITMGELSAEDLAEKMEEVYDNHSIGELLYFEDGDSKVQNQYQAIYMLEMARISTAELDEETTPPPAIGPELIEVSSAGGETIATIKLSEDAEAEPALIFVDGSWKLIGSGLIQASAE